MRHLLLLSLLLFGHHVLAAPAAFDSATFNQQQGPLNLLRITPAGKDVPSDRQIVFQFSRPVVPVGQMERDAKDIPVSIAPQVNCEWRWLNTSALACQLSDKDRLKPATRYRIVMMPGIRAEDGASIKKPFSHSFITRRPKVTYREFKTWQAPGQPQLRVSFNLPVSRESVAQNVYFEHEQQRVAAEVSLPLKKGEKLPKFSNSWYLTPVKELPLDAHVYLRVQPGLNTDKGPELGIEKRTVTEFDTFPAFAFLGIACENNARDQIVIMPGDKTTAKERCNPLRSVYLRFNTPVTSKKNIQASFKLKPDLAGGRTDYDPWERLYTSNDLNSSHSKGNIYSIRLPELLKAWQPYQLALDAEVLQDAFGRPLNKSVKVSFATDHRLPDYNFEHQYSTLESNVDSEVPIVVTNLKALNLEYSVLSSSGLKEGQKHVLKLPAVEDIAYKTPLHIRKLLEGKSGVIQGTFTTTPDIERPYYQQDKIFAQVTPFHVHAKAGHNNTLVWVTDMATGKPVPGVRITAYPQIEGSFTASPQIKAEATTNFEGLATLPGVRNLDPSLELLNNYSNEKPQLYLFCEKGEDVALLGLDYNFRVDLYDLSVNEVVYDYPRENYGHIHTWGTTAQGVYKVGDTVQYKILVRDQSNTHFVPAPAGNYHLEVSDPMGRTVHEQKDVVLSQFGSFSGEFKIPESASVGWYNFSLKADFIEGNWQPLRVLISDFTPSPFRVGARLNGEIFETGDQVAVETSATLHAGGPYVDAHTQVYARIEQHQLSSKNPAARDFWFDVWQEEIYGSETVHQSEGELNDKGLLNTEFKMPESKIVYGQLFVESTVRDDRGKDVAQSASALYVGRDRYVGVKQESWVVNAGKPTHAYAIVVDKAGEPVAGSAVEFLIERRVTKAARVKSAGNAYLTQYEHSWEEASRCQTTATNEAVSCEFTPDKAGYYRVSATIHDSKNRAHSSQYQQWVSGAGDIVWETSDSNKLDMVAEKDDYKVGDTARYIVQNPFPGAQALITVERYGVLKSWVTTFDESLEIVEIPVEADYLPGFYVSVLVTSPRVEKPIDANQVDLGKPVFRMAYARVDVKDPYKQLQVDIQSDKPVYLPGSEVKLQFHAKPRLDAVKNQQPIEIAVAVLDESVFDLLARGLDYFDPYKGFYTLDDLDVRNFNLLRHLVGRQKFERKGANPGGDGGAELSLRSVFKFVSYWNPSLKTDADGKAEVSFKVPDNLTGWRVLAMAMTPEDLMGLSDYNFKVNQPLELRPVLPNQVLQGDSFQAGFSVLNRTDSEREVTLEIQAVGPLKGETNSKQTLKVAPYKRELVWLPLTTSGPGEITLIAKASDGEAKDAMQHTLPVRKRRAMDTAATYGTTEQAEVTESVKFPENIHTDVGNLTLNLSPSILNNLEGAFEYMRDYPYACWEQKLSKGVMASHYQQLKPWIDENLQWADSAALPQQTLDLAPDFQAPNGGMAFYVPTNERVSPYLSAYTALAMSWLGERKLDVAPQVESKLHEYLQTLLRKNVMPDFYSKGMASSVRAVALAALARRGKATLEDIRRYAPHTPEMSLFGKAHFLLAAQRIKDGGDELKKLREEVVDDILAHSVRSGGKISFNETLDSGYARILATPLRDNCAILSALLDEEKSGDLPFVLVRSIIASRSHNGRWTNTQENMYCMNALIDYAKVYESTDPNFNVQAWLDEENLGQAQFKDRREAGVSLKHEITEQDPGRAATVKIAKEGKGRVYYGLRMQYSLLEEHDKAVNAGIDIRREYSIQRDGKWELLQSPMRIKTGDLVRVDLFLSLPTARNYVVVDDPVPGGLEPVNRDLATSSVIAAEQGDVSSDFAQGSYWETRKSWMRYAMDFWSFYHQELRHHAAIFYSDYLPAGDYHLRYSAQAIASGEFSAMPAHAEEMYEPDIYGHSTPARLIVERAAD